MFEGAHNPNEPHRYTVHVWLHGQDHPCSLCGRPRRATLHQFDDVLDAQSGPSPSSSRPVRIPDTETVRLVDRALRDLREDRPDFINSPDYDRWCDEHWSNGAPKHDGLARVGTGPTYCVYCSRTLDDPLLCTGCGEVQPEPERFEPPRWAYPWNRGA